MKFYLLAATAASLFLFSNPAKANDNEQILCMADNIYHEARGEPKDGKYAVGHVVMNRVKDSRFPKTPCSVIKQRSKRICQFSWVCGGKKTDRSSKSYNEALEISEEIYYNKSKDVTNGAKYFHARRIKPSWAFTFIRTIVIGNHIFYKGRK